MMSRFWEVVYDDENSKMEVAGETSDDTLLTFNISEMQDAGMRVRCNAPDQSTPVAEIKLPFYEWEANLYNKLITQYEEKTGKRLKRW